MLAPIDDVQHVLYVINTTCLLPLTLAGYGYSMYCKIRDDRTERRAALEKACERIDVDFALNLFDGWSTPDGTALTAESFQGIFYVNARSSVAQRTARHRLIVFCETLRPASHMLANPRYAHVLLGPHNPIAFRFRLAVKAMSAMWSPHTDWSAIDERELDDYKCFLHEKLGGDHDWRLLQEATAHVGLARLPNPSVQTKDAIPACSEHVTCHLTSMAQTADGQIQ